MSWNPEPPWDWPQIERQQAILLARRVRTALPELIEYRNAHTLRSVPITLMASPERQRLLSECFPYTPAAVSLAPVLRVLGEGLCLQNLQSTWDDHVTLLASGKWVRLFLPERPDVDLELYGRLRLDGFSPQEAMEATCLLA